MLPRQEDEAAVAFLDALRRPILPSCRPHLRQLRREPPQDPAHRDPPDWPRFLGLDFGGVNTAGIFFAQERDAYHKPTGRLLAYREYRGGDRSAAEHCYHLMQPFCNVASSRRPRPDLLRPQPFCGSY